MATVYSIEQGLPAGPVDKIYWKDNTLTAQAKGTSYTFQDESWVPATGKSPVRNIEKAPVPKGTRVLAQARYKNSWAVGTDQGLYLYEGKKPVKLYPADSRYSWSLRNVAALTVDSQGRLWFGADEGVGYLDGKQWRLFTGKEGLPYTKFTCAAAGPNGTVWFGTERGAIVAQNDFFRYRASRRWLPNDHVLDIAVQPNGTAWIATRGGISRIEPREMTLEAKADYFTNQVETRHNRMGFIAQNELTKQFQIESSQVAISDNDGMYTAMYGAAQAFRYAATGSAKARELAIRSFRACKWLVDITHEPGFPARVIIPADWHEPVNEQYGREYNKKRQATDPQWKDIYPRFPKSKDGKYLYKIDTSSDELAGHYFFYGIYYDLVAKTEQEKQEVRQVVGDITDHLIRHGYKLTDHDGKVTRWGDFSPEYFSSVYGYDQRGLNSMMMLSFLNVARHVTGDVKYDAEAKKLRDTYQYHIFALHPKEYFPAENVVPWDNNLCLMSLYGLLKYETDPALLLMYRQSLENAWLHISKQKNAFWDTIYESLADEFTRLVDQKAFARTDLFPENHLYAPSVVKTHYRAANHPAYILENLQKIPLDLIGYTMHNTHRLDVVLDGTPGQSEDMGWRTDGLALPVDERAHVRQDRDGFALNASEGDGYSEHEGTFFLLPYYMALYHKLLDR
ncbi:hypothetical protein GCM10027275_51790 [Rhabdobacter roseus]